jgi:hypothetical protein
MTLKITSGAAGAAVVLASSVALAQFDADASASGNVQVGGQAQGQAQAAPPPIAPAQGQTQDQGQVGMALPNQPDAAAGQSDHDQMVGRLAIGYLGLRGLTMPDQNVTNAPPGEEFVATPVVGIRYWIDQMLGIDAGLGFYTASSSVTTQAPGATAQTQDEAWPTVIIVHAGVPLSLTSSDHFSFQVVPELNFGYGSRTVDPSPQGGTADQSDIHFDIGARAGAEVQFGFIDVPQLSLQAGIGLGVNLDSQKVKVGAESSKRSLTTIGTNVGDNPWNIFIGNVAALYYF